MVFTLLLLKLFALYDTATKEDISLQNK